MFRTAGFVLVASMMTLPSIHSSRRGLRSLGDRRLYGLHLELDVDSVAHEHAAGLQRLVPLQPEVLPIDRGLGGEADALVAPGILGPAAVVNVQTHLASDAPDRQPTDDA